MSRYRARGPHARKRQRRTITDVTTPAVSDRDVPAALLDGLNAEQTAAVCALNGPVLVVAGPGSGKTRVLVHRIAALVHTHTTPAERILAVTFTNKAAGEMRERLESLLGSDTAERMWVSTFHSLCARILRREHEAADLPRAYSILDSDEAASVIRPILTNLGLPDSLKDAREYGKLISRVKNGGTPSYDPHLDQVYLDYQQALHRLGSVDFDDLLLRTAQLLRDNPAVRARWAQRFSHILIDEYQDTNPVQYELVSLLAGGHRNLCCVGDADQAIYGFRSASPQALVNFQNDWPDARVIYLGENYRCTTNILTTAQAIIEGTPSPLRPQLRTANPAGDEVRLLVCGDDRVEATTIAEECRAIRSSNPGASIGVLTRTRAMTRSLEEAMRSAGVPYTIVGALRFYDRAEIKDVIAHLKFVVNPHDTLALGRLLSSPRRGLGEQALADLLEAAGQYDVSPRDVIADPESFGLPRRTHGKWVELDAYLTALEHKSLTTDPGRVVAHVLDSGLRQHIAARNDDAREDRLDNVDELVTAAHAFLDQAHPLDPDSPPVRQLAPREQLEAFLTHVALLSGDEEADTASGPIPILTAHASKGKEFDHVYVCGLEDGLFPHSRSTSPSALEEERRLLFVACSRARQRLTLSRAERRLTFREYKANPPSAFLADLPDHVRVVHKESSYTRGPRSTPTWGGAAGASSSRRPGAPERGVKTGSGTGPRLSDQDAVVGKQVEHRVFGQGTITSVDNDNDTLSIVFADGIKILKRSMAPLSVAASS